MVCVADLAVGDDPRPAAEILAGVAALGDRVDYALSLHFVFHLPERSHDREKHGTHGRRCVDVATAQVQHTEASAAAAQPFGEGEHVLRRSPQPVQSRDDESVAGLEGVDRAGEVRPRGASAGHAVVDVEVIASDIVGFTRGAGESRLFDYAGPKADPQELPAQRINPYLIDGPDLFVEKRMKPLSPSLPAVNLGSKATDWGNYTFGPDEYDQVMSDAVMARYARPLIGGEELISSLDRWCLWLVDLDPKDLARSPELKRRVEAVRALRLASKKAATRAKAATPSLFDERRQPNTEYLAIPNTFSESRLYMTVGRLPANSIAAIKLFTAEDLDGFLFSVFSSTMMLTWQKLVGGRLKSDPSFANTLVWNTFPLPIVSENERGRVITAGKSVLDVRKQFPDKSLADLYNPLAMPPTLIAAHDALDKVVDRIFGFAKGPPWRTGSNGFFLPT